MNNKEYKTIKDSIEAQIAIFFKMHEDSSPESGLYDRVMQEVERILIQSTIAHTNGVHIKAAKILGINRNTLRKKIKDLKIVMASDNDHVINDSK